MHLVTEPLLVVSHDAGGAELAAGWLEKHGGGGFACVAEGPALRVFGSDRFGSMRTLSRDSALSELARFGTVLTGTSWASDLERVFIRGGKELGIRTIAYLDHWTDYRQRFLSDGQPVLPDEIWVGDPYAERIASAAFPGQRIRLVENAYVPEIAARIRAATSAVPRSSRKRVLFVSEPLSAAAERKYGDANHYGYTEMQALAAFLRFAAAKWQDVESVRIRRHPSEARGKFNAFLAERLPFPMTECGEATLIDDCAWADRIVGCQSMALVVGLFAGKEVFCAIPGHGRPSAIPYPGIVSLFQPRQEAQGVIS